MEKCRSPLPGQPSPGCSALESPLPPPELSVLDEKKSPLQGLLTQDANMAAQTDFVPVIYPPTTSPAASTPAQQLDSGSMSRSASMAIQVDPSSLSAQKSTVSAPSIAAATSDSATVTPAAATWEHNFWDQVPLVREATRMLDANGDVTPGMANDSDAQRNISPRLAAATLFRQVRQPVSLQKSPPPTVSTTAAVGKSSSSSSNETIGPGVAHRFNTSYNESAETATREAASLLRNGRLYYEDLRASARGRHLLLVSLLEQVDAPLWAPRAGGRVQLYLPDSLRCAVRYVLVWLHWVETKILLLGFSRIVLAFRENSAGKAMKLMNIFAKIPCKCEKIDLSVLHLS